MMRGEGAVPLLMLGVGYFAFLWNLWRTPRLRQQQPENPQLAVHSFPFP